MRNGAKILTLAAMLFGVTAGLSSGLSWAEDSCSGTTIAHSSADCLKATFSNNNTTLALENECTYSGNSVLGKVNAEVKISNWALDQPDGSVKTGTLVYTRTLTTGTSVSSSISGGTGDSQFIAARCCPAAGICQKTDCDTTNGVIDDTNHSSHCYLVNDTTGKVVSGVKDIKNGVVEYTTQ